MRYRVAVMVPMTGSLEVVKRIAQKCPEYRLCWLFMAPPAFNPFISMPDALQVNVYDSIRSLGKDG